MHVMCYADFGDSAIERSKEGDSVLQINENVVFPPEIQEVVHSSPQVYRETPPSSDDLNTIYAGAPAAPLVLSTE
jgi:hypothetical protein